MWCVRGDQIGQSSPEYGRGVIADDDREFARRVGGLEDPSTTEDTLDAGQGQPGALAQIYTERRQLISIADPMEDLVREMAAQPRQRGRDRRLGDAELLGRPGDALVLHDRVESDEKVQVQIRQCAQGWCVTRAATLPRRHRQTFTAELNINPVYTEHHHLRLP